MSRMGRVVLVAAAVAASAAAAVPATAGRLPASLPAGASGAYVVPIVWQGQTWTARQSPVARLGPGGNYWLATPQTVFTDASGALHLVASKVAGTWYSVALQTTKNNYGYGTYRFVVNTPMDSLDPNAVVGMFTYNAKVFPSRQEADVELSRWGQPAPTAHNAQWVVQPWQAAGHMLPFSVPRTTAMTYEFTWKPNVLTFRARVGSAANGRIVNTWRTTKALPGNAQSGTQVHLNLWFQRHIPPYNGLNQEVVFQSFSYTPLP